MARRDLVEMYCAPDEYNPPVDKDFVGSTQYPNLNSEEYRRRFSLTSKAQEFYENLICNERNQVLVVTNDYRRRLWSGKFLLYSDLQALKDRKPAIAEHPCQSPITTVVFQSNDKILFGSATGSLELWEVQPAAKSESLGVYKVDSKSAHLDVVSKVEMFANTRTKFVTSSYDGCLKVWEIENRELMNTSTYHGAHSSAVTDISVHSAAEQFVSVSRDKSALIWDPRQVLPATELLSDHPYHLTACNWKESADVNVVQIGDAKGDLFQVDTRVPDKIVSSISVFDRPLRKIGRCADKWIVCGNSTQLKRVNMDLSGELETVISGDDWIRDFLVTAAEVSDDGKKGMDRLQVMCMNGDILTGSCDE